MTVKNKKWWQEIVVYQIYPRSFFDANGDGIGDLRGVIEKLDYLKTLGIGAIWMSPVYKSPNDDNGYDISDYEDIMDEFGTMEDMDELLEKANECGIRIVMDLVVNHTSDEHRWFVEAKKSKENPCRDYYIWADPKEDGGVPTDLQSAFSGPAWTFDEASGQYYLHQFSKKQPDLNWENEKMRHEIYDMINFWIDKGVGGFRLDVIDLIGKVPLEGILGNGPKLHQLLNEMNRNTFGKHDLLTVGETWGATPEIAKLYSGENRDELSMIFQFEHIMLDQVEGKEKWDLKPLDWKDLKKVFEKWQIELENDGWNSLFWNNHDLPRIVSRWGNDTTHREQSAKAFAILLHLLKGTPYIYQGEEIGMTNTKVTSVDEMDDIESINLYHERLAKSYSKEEILQSINTKGRDNARRPIGWSSESHGGFTKGTPWLALNENYQTINVEAALEDKSSIFYTYQKLIQLRKDYPVIVWGDFKLLDTTDEVFAYYREYEGKKLLVVCNLSDQTNEFSSTDDVKQVLIANTDAPYDTLNHLTLAPWEAFVVEV